MLRLAAAFACLSFVACAHVPVSTDLTAVVRQKAAFDLNCNANELVIMPLTGGQETSMGMAATSQKSYGVEGCGRRASYYAYCTNMMGSQSCDAMQSSQMLGGVPAAPPATP